MTKAAHLLTSILFLIVCAAVWWLWKLGAEVLGKATSGMAPLPVMTFLLGYYSWVLALPVPAIVYSATLMDRTDLLPEKVQLYFVVICLVSAVLILGTIILFGMEAAALHSPPVGQ